ncbi:phage integrase [Psychromonas sp. Urea-02u-13]|uniref:phage integrase n=1 Tax=Psychromonas sp. Urea-02u-13 TaxID=2058326 RepID=UPI000C32531A|nr:tyrosine-type recombinase/integrase [Psychromonas sp. Urea-02u-13]PKG40592.1 integrase [Psychromonas sp. Urea-02u-13]
MSLTKKNKKWHADIRPSGRDGKRYRKQFDTKTEAENWPRHIISIHNQKEWIDKPKETRKLSELIELWWHYHAQHLKRANAYLTRANKLCRMLNDPTSHEITTPLLADFQAIRLSKVSPSTYNRDMVSLSNVYTVLKEKELIHCDNPFAHLKIKEVAPDLSFLSIDEIKLVLSHLKGSHLLIVKICLSTGARFIEAETLKYSNVLKDKITFTDTKSGKPRTVPISFELYSELKLLAKGDNGRLFDNCYSEFLKKFKQLDIHLLKGQVTHVMRHSFASHYIINGGNLLNLQKILGHSNILITMKYAHLSPDYLKDVLDKNPLNNL